MTEVRDLSSATVVTGGSFEPGHQYGLFATTAYSEGDVVLTESPLVVLSTRGTDSSKSSNDDDNDVRSQFLPSSVAASATTKSKGDADVKTTIMGNLILPSDVAERLSASHKSKLRAMLLVLASYAVNPPTNDTKKKIFELYHPSINSGDSAKKDKEEKDALELANLALQCGQKMAAPKSPLSSLLGKNEDVGELTKLLLIYSCNAFEGGRIYHKLSRSNHSCNPNAVVVEGESSSEESVLKAACDIAPGEEICISYLGKYLFAGYPIRQRMLKANKHFVCQCERCSTDGVDLAARIPCPICHPRTGRYLDEDVMFDEDADNEGGFKVCYAAPRNGLTAEQRQLHCTSCKGITTVVADDAGGSMRKKKEGMAIKYMCMAEDKVFDHLEGQNKREGKKQQKNSNAADDPDPESEIEQQFLQMATSICGSQHWTTHFLNLSMIEESLASFHSALLTMGQDPEKDAEMMEDLFVEIAEVTDGIEKANNFAKSLKLKLDPSHWLFDYTVGLARTLVGLGDTKSQKYGSEWVQKVETYAERFENQGMNKVVVALRDAWKRGKADEVFKGGENESKRRKIG